MNSALKPVLPQPGVPQPGGQSSPAKGNVASANHAGALPQGAQNHSLPAAPNHALPSAPNHALPSAPNHALPSAPGNALPGAPSHALPGGPSNSLHSPAPHPAACMAPVSANMAQMAQNMSHHGNLSHMPLPPPASPSKAASTSAPLSLVQDKVPPPSQPLALTRTPDKKEPESTAQANGTIDSPKSATNAPTVLKPQNPETNKDKQDIAKTSPSTPKPPEKPSSAPSTPQKIEPAIPSCQSDVPAQPKVATANEPPEKSPSKPIELKQAPAADVAPTQSDSKPVPESANDSQLQEKVPPTKQEAPSEVSKESPKVDVKQDEPKVDKPAPVEDKEDVKEKVEAPKVETAKVDTPKADTPKVEPEKPQKTEVVPEKVEEKKPPTKAELKPKSTLKLATVTPPMRKRRQASPSKPNEGPGPAKKAAEGDSTPDSRTKRNRTKVQLYQSPTPELAMATKLSASAGRSTPTKPNDDKLIVFYKNEYLAVRNAEGGFYVCQTMQNVYRTTRKIKIRWLSQDKTADPSGETYKPDFYDVTDMECVLTTLSLQRAAGGAQSLRRAERDRAESILLRALRAERPTHLTPEHPDGLDLSLYTDESQLEKKGRKRNSSKSSPRAKLDQDDDTTVGSATPVKKARTTPKRSPKSGRKTKITPTKIQNNNKRKSPGSTPIVAATSKTATAVSEKAKAKSTPAKRTPVKHKDTPVPRKATRASRESKQSPIVPTPSTSTGKTTRTPRKPPAKK